MEEPKKNSSFIVGGIVVFIVALASYGIFQYTKKNTGVTTEIPIQPPIKTYPTPSYPTPPYPTPPGASVYKDGAYSVIGNYYSPGGSEEIAVQITLKNDVIVAAEVQANNPSGGTAARYQETFISNFKQYVIGKKIDTVELGRISGSSLTPKGFNDALAKVKVLAKI